MKLLKRSLLILFLGIVVEIFLFNYPTLITRSAIDIEKNQVYTTSDMTFINWEMNGNLYISQEDPQILISSMPMDIKKVDLEFDTEPSVHRCTFYYTDDMGEINKVEKSNINKKHISFFIDRSAKVTTRIDIGENAGIKLNEIKVTINSTDWNISIERVIAIVLIYLCGSLLFLIQRPIDYHLDCQLKNRREDEDK